jgi:hypothetical protein
MNYKLLANTPASPVGAIAFQGSELPPNIGNEIRRVRAESASVEAGMEVASFWRPGYIGNDGKNGCRAVILEVLAEAGRGLTTDEIEEAARAKGLCNKYPHRTFKHNLSNIMKQNGEVKAIAIERTGKRGRPPFVWVLGTVSQPQ